MADTIGIPASHAELLARHRGWPHDEGDFPHWPMEGETQRFHAADPRNGVLYFYAVLLQYWAQKAVSR